MVRSYLIITFSDDCLNLDTVELLALLGLL